MLFISHPKITYSIIMNIKYLYSPFLLRVCSEKKVNWRQNCSECSIERRDMSHWVTFISFIKHTCDPICSIARMPANTSLNHRTPSKAGLFVMSMIPNYQMVQSPSSTDRCRLSLCVLSFLEWGVLVCYCHVSIITLDTKGVEPIPNSLMSSILKPRDFTFVFFSCWLWNGCPLERLSLRRNIVFFEEP